MHVESVHIPTSLALEQFASLTLPLSRAGIFVIFFLPQAHMCSIINHAVLTQIRDSCVVKKSAISV